MHKGQVLAMKTAFRSILVLTAIVILFGCEFKKNVSRGELPIIKESIVAFENVLKARSTVYLDSILSSEAAEQGMTPQLIMDFVYSDGLTEFVGFTQKQIYFRGNAARVDCKVTGPEGPTKDVTITFRKENEVWLLKKIENKIIDPPEEDQT